MTTADFKLEMVDAVKRYNRFIVSLGRSPDEFLTTLVLLMGKAIIEYESRPDLSRGAAVARDVTVILSRREGKERPFCNIYFNLHSDYWDHYEGRLP
jgi:hypothetical protein